MLGIRCILVIAILFQVYSFQLPSQQHGHYLVTRRVTGSLAKSNTMLRLFEGKDSLAVNANPAVTSPTLSDISKSFIQTNLGIQDSSLFADTIQISGPNFNKYMSKDKYLLETKDAWTPVQQALDNFNWNVHGIQVDAQNSQKVWLKVQPSGKFTKLFYYQDELFEPSKKEVVFPLQEWSLTFNAEGRIEAITTDYIIDRFNNAMTTNSLQGVQGLLHTVGQSPSEFAYLPPLLVMQRFLARRRKPLVPKKLSSSPFPEAVMFALTKQVLESKFGAEMPSLLSESMQVSDPIQGPWNRNEYLTEKKSLLGFLQSNGNEFEDVKVVGSNFHIDK